MYIYIQNPVETIILSTSIYECIYKIYLNVHVMYCIVI